MNKKRLFVLLVLSSILSLSFSFSSCSKDDGDKSEGLNSYETALVGSYISDDDDYEVLYLTLKSDRTGSFEMKWGGESKTKYNIFWSATRTTFTLTNQSNGETYSYEYVLNGKHLVYSDVSFQKQ